MLHVEAIAIVVLGDTSCRKWSWICGASDTTAAGSGHSSGSPEDSGRHVASLNDGDGGVDSDKCSEDNSDAGDSDDDGECACA